jgi:hypothetical protein
VRKLADAAVGTDPNGPTPTTTAMAAGIVRTTRMDGSVANGVRLCQTYSGVTGGFRFFLVLEDGEPADPGMFVTAIPTWKPGDEFLAGSELRRSASSPSSPR